MRRCTHDHHARNAPLRPVDERRTLMAFGQQGGPPATAKQVQALLALLHDAGHLDFRDARGPMGFTQRQAAGKFTRDEADAFIAQLEHEQDAAGGATAGPPPTPPPTSKIVRRAEPTPRRPPTPKAPPRPRAGAAPSPDADTELQGFPTERLAAELQRRGWVVLEP